MMTLLLLIVSVCLGVFVIGGVGVAIMGSAFGISGLAVGGIIFGLVKLILLAL